MLYMVSSDIASVSENTFRAIIKPWTDNLLDKKVILDISFAQLDVCRSVCHTSFGIVSAGNLWSSFIFEGNCKLQQNGAQPQLKKALPHIACFHVMCVCVFFLFMCVCVCVCGGGGGGLLVCLCLAVLNSCVHLLHYSILQLFLCSGKDLHVEIQF